MWTAPAFIAGLLCVVVAQMAAFFTMAKRSEAQEFGVHVQSNRVAALMFQSGTPLQKERMDSATADEAEGNISFNLAANAVEFLAERRRDIASQTLGGGQANRILRL